MTDDVTTLHIGKLAPGVIAAFIALDVLLRCLPLDPLCFRAWECMTRFKTPSAPFEVSRRFHTERAYGNLANIGNLLEFRQYRPQVFTTDRNGFRNPPRVAEEAVDILLLGDSFAAGDAVSDGETLSAQLSEVTGKPVYNAGGGYAYWDTVQFLESRLRLRERRIIVTHQLGLPMASLKAEIGTSIWSLKKGLAQTFLDERGERYATLIRGWWHVSPLKILLQKGYRLLCDDRIFPNEGANLVTVERLQNGARTLFYRQTMEALQHPDPPEQVADYFAWLAEAVRKEGHTLSVVLVPDKYQVYAPLLEGGDSRKREVKASLDEVEAALLGKDIPTLNLLAVFRKEAEEGLATNAYLYWPDDTHWNRRGIQVAADAIHRKWFGTE